MKWTAIVTLLLIPTWTFAGVKIQFDYQYDSLGFFDEPERRDALEAAARYVNKYVDELAEITPGGENTWSTFLSTPAGGLILVENIPVPEDTIIIYPGGAPIQGRLAQAIDAPGIAEGSPEFIDAYMYRGQPGASLPKATDHGLWGGTMTFNSDSNEVPWYFGTEISGIRDSQFDFITVAMHELIHLLGFGTAKSFRDQTSVGGNFQGPEAVAAGSATNPNLELDSAEAHFRSNTSSGWNRRAQEALLAPGIAPGQRQYPTRLDRAVLRDIGWEEAVPGDATLDRVFNSSDLVAMFQAGVYETGKFAAWSDGDFSDNALFTSGDLTFALQQGGYVLEAVPDSFASDAEPDFVSVLYDSQTGRLRLDTHDQFLSSFEIQSKSSALLPDSAEGLTELFDVQRSDKLFKMIPSGFADVEFGEVLPIGLEQDDLQFDLSFDGSFLQGGAVNDVRIHVVPEPIQIVASVPLGILALLRLRRRTCRA